MDKQKQTHNPMQYPERSNNLDDLDLYTIPLHVVHRSRKMNTRYSDRNTY